MVIRPSRAEGEAWRVFVFCKQQCDRTLSFKLNSPSFTNLLTPWNSIPSQTDSLLPRTRMFIAMFTMAAILGKSNPVHLFLLIPPEYYPSAYDQVSEVASSMCIFWIKFQTKFSSLPSTLDDHSVTLTVPGGSADHEVTHDSLHAFASGHAVLLSGVS
jgi:hypothetical protein